MQLLEFSVDELIQNIEGNHIPDMKGIQTHLLDNYGEEIVISTIKKVTIVCLKNTGYKILTDSW